jgi:hypothetical protein
VIAPAARYRGGPRRGPIDINVAISVYGLVLAVLIPISERELCRPRRSPSSP